MNKSEQKCYQIIFNLINQEKNENGRTFSENDIFNIVDEKLDFFRGIYNKEEIRREVIINELLMNINISIGSSDTIYCLNNIKWINDYKQNNNNFTHWDNYKKYLSETVNLTDDVIYEIDKSTDHILDGMANPKLADFTKKGMVIGYVQSGKTSNYVGLINKSIDVGYKFIVVLAGMHNNLRQQTQMRIDQGVVGHSRLSGVRTKCGVGNLIGVNLPPVQLLTTADYSGNFNAVAANTTGINFLLDTPLIAVVLKNRSVLENLNDWIEGFLTNNNINQSEKPILIIDDECDQASIDTNFNADNYDVPKEDENGEVIMDTPSAINGQINSLLQKFKKRAYVGYTATPYANIFIPIDNPHYKNIFPEHFIVRLDQPKTYLGPEKYFDVDDVDDNTLPGLLLTYDEEGFYNEIREYQIDSKNNTITREITIPDSLTTATYLFILSGAIRMFRGQQEKHMSMLIHVSYLTNVQTHLRKQFEAKWGEITYNINENDTTIHGELQKLFEGEYSNTMGISSNIPAQKDISEIYRTNFSKLENYDLPTSYTILKEYIKKFIIAVEIIDINSKSTGNLNFHLYPNGRKVIAIGGNTMARGLTLEGLHTSYFVRNAGAYDTLMQMGRWFGYRTHFSDLCRIITTDQIAQNFGEVCRAEIIMRNDIDAMVRANVPPKEFLIRIRTSANRFAVTGKLGMSGAMQTQWSGGEIISRLISRNPDVVNHNFDVLKNLITTISPSHTNEIIKNNIVYKNIPRRFLKIIAAMKVVNNSGQLNFEKIEEYYELCKFEYIDIVIIGKSTSNSLLSVNYTFNDYEIGLSERNSEETSNNRYDNELFRVKNSKLTDANYLSNFISEDDKNTLTDKQLQNPNILCSKILNPIISFLPINPYYFYSKEEINRVSRPNLQNIDKRIEEIKAPNSANFKSIPFGISVATPLYGPNNTVLNQESVLVGLTVLNAINNNNN